MTTNARAAQAQRWVVRPVDWADFSEQVGAFVSRAEVEEWIANKPSEWLNLFTASCSLG